MVRQSASPRSAGSACETGHPVLAGGIYLWPGGSRAHGPHLVGTLQWAQAFAGRVIESAGANLNRQIETAFRLAYSRLPDKTESNMAREFFQRHRSLVAERAGKGEELALPPKLPKTFDPSHAATLVDFCHMLINANEFVFVN